MDGTATEREETRNRFENEGYAVMTGESAEVFARLEERAQRVEGQAEEVYRFGSKSKSMEAVNEWLKTLQKDSMKTTAQNQETPVLILGESGTGKEGIARMIHAGSKRARGPWISINCRNYKAHALEHELFGTAQKRGLLDLAKGGTLFLNNIEGMDQKIQTRMIHSIQAGTYADVRLVAASNQELSEYNSEGRFNEEFYQHFSGAVIEVPSLRNRTEDIIPMAEHFMKTAFAQQGKHFEGFTEDAKSVLLNYIWPGNVYELFNVTERAALLFNKNGAVDVEDITNLESVVRISPTTATRKRYEFNETYQPGISMDISQYSGGEVNYTLLKKKWSNEFEKEYLQNLLARTRGNVTAAAKESGIDRSNFLRILRRHKISAQYFRSGMEIKKAA